MKFGVFWGVAPCSQVEVDYTALHPRRRNFKLASNSSLRIFNLALYYSILCSLHTKIKLTAFFCHEICSTYNLLTC
jgi:hypothetical protein